MLADQVDARLMEAGDVLVEGVQTIGVLQNRGTGKGLGWLLPGGGERSAEMFQQGRSTPFSATKISGLEREQLKHDHSDEFRLGREVMAGKAMALARPHS